jgi:hypothetical protein
MARLCPPPLAHCPLPGMWVGRCHSLAARRLNRVSDEVAIACERAAKTQGLNASRTHVTAESFYNDRSEPRPLWRSLGDDRQAPGAGFSV